jgi:hypothetical protein
VAAYPSKVSTNYPVWSREEGATAVLRIVEETSEQVEGLPLDLDELAREGARRLLIEALDAEVEAYLERHREARDERGHALVVRNGHGRERKVAVG